MDYAGNFSKWKILHIESEAIQDILNQKADGIRAI